VEKKEKCILRLAVSPVLFASVTVRRRRVSLRRELALATLGASPKGREKYGVLASSP
jgi:hypothetical protein